MNKANFLGLVVIATTVAVATLGAGFAASREPAITPPKAKPELEYRVLRYTCPGFGVTIREQRQVGDTLWNSHETVTISEGNPVLQLPYGNGMCLIEQLEAYRPDAKHPVGAL